MATNRLGFRCYVSSRPFGGVSIPVPVQNLVLRDYARRKGLVFKLGYNENIFPHSYMVLETMAQTLSGLEGILMCSMFMLPRRRERRRRLFDAVLDQGAELHLALEDMVIARAADIVPLEEIFDIHATLPLCPRDIPDLPPLA